MIPSFIPILGSEALRALEQLYAQAQPPLMERAGQAAAAWALELLGEARGPVLVLVGPGNNGGDGYVLARELAARGLQVVLATPAGVSSLPPDARAARERWLASGGQIVSDFIGTRWALAVDALFGIGLKRPPAGLYAEWIVRLNALTCPVLALDTPSGLDAETGACVGPTVRASHTASFIAHKPGLLTLDGPDHCGELRLFDLDLPVPEDAGRVLAPELFSAHLQPRRRNVHKGDFGAVGVIGGAAGMQGAALLAARAALHLGPGKVFLGLLDAQSAGVDPLYPELMLRAPGELALLVKALALGPGLGRGETAQAQLRRALGFAGPLLLDADALNLLAEDPPLQDLLRRRAWPGVLTPHPAEAARLLGTGTAAVQADRLRAAQALARRFNAEVILKGCGSIVAGSQGAWFINASGNAGMAVGGMGDVLTGLIVALLAQGWPALDAAAAACHLHGCAADQLACEGIGPVGLTPSETMPAARRIFNAWLKR
ncbi:MULTISPECIES: NAD(P)H-hydrate dehydratase [unclassified Uliginosibacterium]|uniref:NAD(P)H-hydrate dehydratase n=1 Tax=unclassified Uliginosibacterium TaxID=2621521 RepID=UPI000C79B923|nr:MULTISPECIES: NAD(P)H-hydrate dehydratase [unclassified Uliginosibacterium]MDO6385802.1 NAD(P)H-hydrate dehydratase [Uliginosibacterium sp. 31-12]PLK50182.1 bifunctional ADP-dependent NAD(P)H-hydrate dehydratase/NAD(P)H-hydrate epimerase [Uliginosibacterium sp. TH139]